MAFTNYDLILIDGDGTLLTDEKTISQENKAAVNYAIQKGVRVAVCSGRSYASLKEYAETLGVNKEGDFVVSFNGCLIFNAQTGEPLDAKKLPSNTAKMIITEIKKAIAQNNAYSADMIIYHEIYAALIEKVTEYTETYRKLAKIEPVLVPDIMEAIKEDVYKLLIVGSRGELQKICEHIEALGRTDINVFFSADYLLEVTRLEATKGNALQFLASTLNIPTERVMAIGDHLNDLSMIKAAGMGVAMSNSTRELIEAADYITERDNNNSGVAEAIYKFI